MLGCTDGRSNCRTIGTVEAMLILSEWPPSVMFMEDKVGASSRRDRKSSVSACKQQNDIAWTLVGLVFMAARDWLTDRLCESLRNLAFMMRAHTRRRAG